ncbi:MAG: hypothetical protein ABEJ65_10000 [bacterium]
MLNISFDHLDYDLTVHRAFLLYNTNFSPAEERNSLKEEALEELVDDSNDLKNSLREPLLELDKICQVLINADEPITKILPSIEFHFIVCHMRSGGELPVKRNDETTGAGYYELFTRYDYGWLSDL